MGPDRAAALSRVRSADPALDAAADRRRTAGPARRGTVLSARAGRADRRGRTTGTRPRRSSMICRTRALRGCGWMAPCTGWTRSPRGSGGRGGRATIEVVVDRLVAREASRARITDSVETALKLAGGRYRRADRPAGGRPGPGAAVLRAPVLPERAPAGAGRAGHRSRSRSTRRWARARSVRDSAPSWCPTSAWSYRTAARRWPAARSRPGRIGRTGSTSPGCSGRPRTRAASAWRWPGTSCRRRRGRPCCTAPASRCGSATAPGPGGTAPTGSGSKACWPGSSGGTPKPRPTRRGRSSGATCGPWPARPAAGPGCGRRSWPSRWRAARSPR